MVYPVPQLTIPSNLNLIFAKKVRRGEAANESLNLPLRAALSVIPSPGRLIRPSRLSHHEKKSTGWSLSDPQAQRLELTAAILIMKRACLVGPDKFHHNQSDCLISVSKMAAVKFKSICRPTKARGFSPPRDSSST